MTLNGEVPAMLELCGMHSNPLLPSFLSSLGPGVIAPDRVLFTGQIELNCYYAKVDRILSIGQIKRNCIIAKLNDLK